MEDLDFCTQMDPHASKAWTRKIEILETLQQWDRILEVFALCEQYGHQEVIAKFENVYKEAYDRNKKALAFKRKCDRLVKLVEMVENGEYPSDDEHDIDDDEVDEDKEAYADVDDDDFPPLADLPAANVV
jgi:hypothetical protein